MLLNSGNGVPSAFAKLAINPAIVKPAPDQAFLDQLSFIEIERAFGVVGILSGVEVRGCCDTREHAWRLPGKGCDSRDQRHVQHPIFPARRGAVCYSPYRQWNSP
nr:MULTISPECIES: hypothetical protein [unclassified Pseudomonas]